MGFLVFTEYILVHSEMSDLRHAVAGLEHSERKPKEPWSHAMTTIGCELAEGIQTAKKAKCQEGTVH